MSYNFFFLSEKKDPASTIQAIQRASATTPDPRPRPSLQILDRGEEAGFVDPQQQPFTVPTVHNLGPRRAPAPRPQNVEITSERAASVRAESRRSVSEIHKTIQPTAWSRRNGLAGSHHGANEYGLRLLSEGGFLGLITTSTRSIAESVLELNCSKQLETMALTLIPLPNICIGLWVLKPPFVANQNIPRLAWPRWFNLLLPNRNKSPCLKETEAKLRQAQKSQSNRHTPSTPVDSAPDVACDDSVVSDLIEPFDDTTQEEKTDKVKPPLPASTTGRKP